MKLAPSLHRVGSDLINTYLVEENGQLTLIDAGVAGQWSDLTAELTGMGRSISDIRAVVLTHGDTDHVGFAERLRRDHGIPVHVHEADAALARGETKKSVGMGPMKIGPMLRFMWYAGRRGGLRTTPIREVETFTNGATLNLPGSPRIVHTPGHTPGSVAIHVPSVDARWSRCRSSRPSPPPGSSPAMARPGTAASPRRYDCSGQRQRVCKGSVIARRRT